MKFQLDKILIDFDNKSRNIQILFPKYEKYIAQYFLSTSMIKSKVDKSMNGEMINNNTGVITLFEINDIIPLSEYISKQHNLLSYKESMLLFYETGQLIEMLKEYNTYIPVFDINDFMVLVSGEKFYVIYVNFNENKLFSGDIVIPLKIGKSSFFSPEVGVKKLPLKIDNPYGSSIYAIGAMVSAYITDAIYGTKLYWAIKRALEERIFLII